MGASKSELFSEQQNLIADITRALSHPARVTILQYLSENQASACGDIVDEIGLAQPTVSRHLKELRSIDLIKGKAKGTSILYSINLERWNEYKSVLETFFNIRLEELSNV